MHNAYTISVFDRITSHGSSSTFLLEDRESRLRRVVKEYFFKSHEAFVEEVESIRKLNLPFSERREKELERMFYALIDARRLLEGQAVNKKKSITS